MIVQLKADNKNIVFLDGSEEINANDDFVQSLIVLLETPLNANERLSVVFFNEESVTYELDMLVRNRQNDSCIVDIPQALINSGGDWNLKLLRHRQAYTGEKTTASNEYPFTVGAGVKAINGKNVTTAELQTAYNEIMQTRDEAQSLANTAGAAAASAQSAAETARQSSLGASSAANYAETQATQATTAASEAAQSATDAEQSRATAAQILNTTDKLKWQAEKAASDAQNAAEIATNAVSGIEGLPAQIAVINTVLEQSGLVSKYKATIEDTYTERVTADGANVLDGSKAKLEKVVGNTVACKNLFNPDRTEQNLGALVDTTPRVFEENKYFVGLASNNYYSRNNVKNFTVNNGAYSFNSINETNTAYGIGFNLSLKEGVSYCYSAKSENTRPTVIFYDANGNYIKDAAVNPFTVPENCKTVVLLFRGADGTKVATFENIQVEEGTTATEYQPYFTGLKSASFAGIESTNADGTETATLAFPKTEMPLGKTIDFENKKITDYGVEIGADYPSIAYSEGTKIFTFSKVNANASLNLKAVSSYYPYVAYGNADDFCFWITSAGEDLRIKDNRFSSVDELRTFFRENNVTIRYLSSVLQSETDFTADNEYTAYKGGTEKVLKNDGKDYGADNTLSQNYIIVTGVK